jgi:hypothetical protein
VFDFDLFVIFTNAIFVAVTVYYALWTVTMIRWTQQILSGGDPGRRLLRLYLSYHLITIDLRPLRNELLQLAAWMCVLVMLFWYLWTM